MSGVINVIFTLSAIGILGMIYHIIAIQKPGVYPPKKILKERAKVLGGGGAILFIIGLIIKGFQ